MEKNHADILELLIKEARQTPEWQEKVSTQTGLEEWVAQVRHKHNISSGPTITVTKTDRGWFLRNWPIGLLIVAISSGMGEFLFTNGFIGFIIGWAIIGFIHLLQPSEKR